MLSENNDFIRDAAGTLQLLNAYSPERERARAAAEYRRTMRKLEKLTNDNAQLSYDKAQLEWQLAEQKTINAELQAEIAQLKNQQ